ncbi:MAG: alpha/beta hydrolase [Syntrophaceae bacterium]
MKFEDKYIKIGNVNTRFWEYGEGEPLILIHGLGTSIEVFEPNIPELAKTCKVYAPDLVGFGYSDKPKANYTMAFLTDFLHDFLVQMNINKASLLGVSMGGGIALKYAIDYPDRMDKLILEDSAGLGRELALPLRLTSIPLLSKLSFLKYRRAIAVYMRTLVHDPKAMTDEMIDFYYKIFSLPGAIEAFSSVLINSCSLRGINEDIIKGITDKLSLIKCPTLIIWGKQDRSLPVKDALLANKEIPGSKLHLFDNCGHFANLEKTPEFNKIVSKFLSEN